MHVYHWIEKHQPIYCCLTDGSGGAATSRLSSTTRLLNNVGASVGPIYGRYPDTVVYRLLLDGRVDVFVALAQELASALEQAGVDCVAGDAVEGFNPAHDVCRLIVDGAVEILRRRTGREVRNYDFLLDGPPDLGVRARLSSGSTRRRCERKLAAATRLHGDASRSRGGARTLRPTGVRDGMPAPGRDDVARRRASSRSCPTTSAMARGASTTAAIPKSSATATTCARSPWRFRRPRMIAGRNRL